MHIYECVYVCMHVCTYVCINVSVHACIEQETEVQGVLKMAESRSGLSCGSCGALFYGKT